MLKYLSCLLLLLFNVNVNSQETNLIGKWVLVRTLYNDQKFLEINHPDYAQSLIYDIKPNEFKINNFKNFPVEFQKNQIIYPLQITNYTFEGDYLVTNIEGSNLKHYFLKVEDLLKRFSEFSQPTSSNEDYILDNGLNSYDFNQDIPLEIFINRGLKNVVPKNDKRIFEAEFVLNLNHKIEDIKIINSISPKFDQAYKNQLQLAEFFLKNNTDRKLIIKNRIILDNVNVNFFLNSNVRSLGEKIEEYYKNNNFPKIVELSENFDKVIKKENKESLYISTVLKYIAISHLAVGNKKTACDKFNELGDIKNFRVRNFLLDFCKE